MRKANFRVSNEDGMPTIFMYDDIGPEWLGMVSAETVTAELAKLAGQARINVRINSPGGDVFEAFAIYNALTRFSGEIVVDVDALAASAASVIAMAGDKIRMAANSMLMIHNAWTVTEGNAEDHAQVIETLKRVDGNLLDTYVARTGLPTDDVKSMMAAETWMTASEAVSKGFCDEIAQPLQVAAAVKAGRFKNTPARFVEAIAADVMPKPKEIAPPPPPPRRLAAALRLKVDLARRRVDNL